MRNLISNLLRCKQSKTGLFELKKDIQIPGQYFRAGERKSKESWEAIFPHSFSAFVTSDWFIDLSKHRQKHYSEDNMPLERMLVDNYFDKVSLYSLSYREAAYKVLLQYRDHHFIAEKTKHEKVWRIATVLAILLLLFSLGVNIAGILAPYAR